MSSIKKKILVVDDEFTHRQLLSNLLQSVPYYQVIEADNGLNALETLKKEQVDLIILDIMMPVMDGFETLAAIREDTEQSHIPVIMCTSVNGQKDVVRILQYNVAAYIVKPVKKNILLSKVQKAFTMVDDAVDGADVSKYHHTQSSTDIYSVLIADEDRNFRRGVKNILSPYYDIIEARDENSVERLSRDKQPQIILLGRLSGALNYENFLAKLSPFIQEEKTKVYRIYSTVSETVEERGLKYHGKMIRTQDANLLQAQLRDMNILPDFTLSHRKSVVVVAPKNYYPQTDAENRMLMRTIAVALDSDVQTVLFDLSDWKSESVRQENEASTPNEDSKANEAKDEKADSDIKSQSKASEANRQKVARCYIEDIIKELKALDIKIEIRGYIPPEDNSLATLLTDELAELRQEYSNYLTTRIARLQQYCKSEDSKAIISLGQNLDNFGKKHGFPQLALLADMLIRESNNNHWNVVEALIEQLSREQKKIAN